MLAWIVAGSNSFQACLAGDTDDLDDASYIRRVADDIPTPTTLQCVGDFLDQNEPSILALTALAVTFFGFGVWSAGRRLQRTTQVFTAAAEDASRLRLRAQVGIEAIEKGLAERDGRWDVVQNSISITVKNFGMTAARQVWIAAQVAADLPDDRALDAYEAGASFTLFSGQSVTVPLARKEAMPANITYVVGHVRYQDHDGQKWRTNFCWAEQSDCAATARFAPYGSHNDEVAET